MAEQEDPENKTEDPSQKRLDEAREKGNIAKSIEINSWFVLAGAFLALTLSFGGPVGTMSPGLSSMLASAHEISFEKTDIGRIFSDSGWVLLTILGAPFFILFLAAVAGPIMQHIPVISMEPVKPQMSRISPLAGLKRMFGKEALVNFAKSLGKLVIVSVAVFMVLWPDRAKLDSFVRMDVGNILVASRDEVMKILIGVLSVFIFVAGGDYFYQRVTWWGRLKMTKQEVKDEHKQQEGSPEIKMRQRQIRNELAKKGMKAKVPEASFVVANPTHFAIAFKYETGMHAPICLAKGIDFLALEIRKIAEENNITVVEDPPLARMLYKIVEVDQEIPVEVYKPVAEVVGYVMRLKARRARQKQR